MCAVSACDLPHCQELYPLLLHSVRVMLQHQPLNLPRTALRHRILAAAHPETPPFVRLTAADALTGRPNLQPVPSTPQAHQGAERERERQSAVLPSLKSTNPLAQGMNSRRWPPWEPPSAQSP